MVRQIVFSTAALIVPFVVQDMLIVQLNRPAVYMKLVHIPWTITWLGVTALSVGSGFVLLAVGLNKWWGKAALIYLPVIIVGLTIIGMGRA
jgi:hypothetical protein